MVKKKPFIVTKAAMNGFFISGVRLCGFAPLTVPYFTQRPEQGLVNEIETIFLTYDTILERGFYSESSRKALICDFESEKTAKVN